MKKLLMVGAMLTVVMMGSAGESSAFIGAIKRYFQNRAAVKQLHQPLQHQTNIATHHILAAHYGALAGAQHGSQEAALAHANLAAHVQAAKATHQTKLAAAKSKEAELKNAHPELKAQLQHEVNQLKAEALAAQAQHKILAAAHKNALKVPNYQKAQEDHEAEKKKSILASFTQIKSNASTYFDHHDLTQLKSHAGPQAEYHAQQAAHYQGLQQHLASLDHSKMSPGTQQALRHLQNEVERRIAVHAPEKSSITLKTSTSHENAKEAAQTGEAITQIAQRSGLAEGGHTTSGTNYQQDLERKLDGKNTTLLNPIEQLMRTHEAMNTSTTPPPAPLNIGREKNDAWHEAEARAHKAQQTDTRTAEEKAIQAQQGLTHVQLMLKQQKERHALEAQIKQGAATETDRTALKKSHDEEYLKHLQMITTPQ